jgi:hypothetical protein
MIEQFAIRQVETGLQNQRENLRHIRTQGAVIGTLCVLIGNYLSGQEVLFLDSAGNKTPEVTEALYYSSVSDVLAILLMISGVCFSLFVILMQAKWRFFCDQRLILKELREDYRLSEIETLDACAKILEGYFWKNEQNISKLNSSLFGAVACSVAQIPFWIMP